MIEKTMLVALGSIAVALAPACDAEGEGMGAERQLTLACAPAECDPLCVDVGAYKVTDQTVTDTRTRLVWQRRVSTRLPQPEAAAYCKDLVLEGIGGFRLPTQPELAGIRYKPGGLFGGGHHYCVPSIDQAAFPDTPADLFWTSRTAPDGTGWYVGFDDGRSHRDVVSDPLWVRCVHDPVAPEADSPSP